MITRDVIAYWEAKREGRRSWQLRTAQQGKKMKEIEMSILAGSRFTKIRILPPMTTTTLSWRQRDVPINRNSDRSDDVMRDLILKPGVAVVYNSQLRYVNAPDEAITVDMFDASISSMGDEVEKATGARKLTQHSPEMWTSMVFREEMPDFLLGKIDTLHVTLKSMFGEPMPANSSVSVPGVGIAYGTGAKWIIITKEDLNGSRWK